MIRRTSAAVLFVLGALAAGACKDKEPDPQVIPVPTSSAAAVPADPAPTAAPADPAPTAGDADGGADASAALAQPSQPASPSEPATPSTTPKASGGSIDACCSALAAIGKSGKSGSTKAKAASAYAVCGGIAQRVKSGDTSRAAGLTQIRSALVGVTVPPECQ